MNRTIAARPLRLVVGIGLVALVFAAVVGGVELVVESAEVAVLLPFVAAAVSMAGLAIVLPRFDRLVTGIAHQPSTTSYSTTAKPAADVQAGSLEQALTDLARVLAEGTRAQCAVVWLAVAQELVSAACHPGTKGARPRTIANLATLLSQPDVDHIVPVLDGSVLRAALTIAKPGRAVTPGDQRFMQDVAYGAGLLLRGAQLNSELQERVRRADDLAVQLQASRQRLTRARDVERQRQIGELLPVHMHIERLVDRLLGANRSTSYEGLAGLTALSRATSSDASNLDGVAEAVARKLGARTLPPDRQLSRAARSHVLVAAR